MKILIIIGLLFLAALVLVVAKKYDSSTIHPQAIQFTHTIVDENGPVNPWGKSVGDLNQDGLLDLIVSGNESQDLFWYENPGWIKHLIANDYAFTTDHEVADVDNDGLVDVISLAEKSIVWFKNPDWTATVIASGRYHDIEVADFDNDGDVDIVVRDQAAFGDSSKSLVFYQQNTPNQWSTFSIAIAAGEGLKVADLDQDGKPDVIINNQWFRNKGTVKEEDMAQNSWQAHTYTNTWEWPHTFISVGDIDGDERPDIILSPAEKANEQYRISWFEAPGEEGPVWQEHIIAENVEAVYHFVDAADMDNDGDTDVVTAQMHQGKDPDEVLVYVNSRKGMQWDKSVVSEKGSHSMRLFDMDNDGDTDLFSANWSGDYQAVELWQNQTCPAPNQDWVRHEIDSDRPWKAVFISAEDMDGDGLKDIITGGWWYQNPKDLSANWQRTAIGNKARNMASVFDIDHDGDQDVLATGGEGSDANAEFIWAENNGQGNFIIHDNLEPADGDFLQGITKTTLSNGDTVIMLSWHKAGYGIQQFTIPDKPAQNSWPLVKISNDSQDEALSAGDIDDDGDFDLLLGTDWLRNDGDQWQKFSLFKSGENPDRNKLKDLNGDGRLDAIIGYEAISKTGLLAWYEAGHDPSKPWKEHRIAEVVGPMSLDVMDMDGDGDLDVIVGEHNLTEPDKGRLLIYENMAGDGLQWQPHLVYQGDEHHDGAQVVDIDNDGDMDIISIGWSHNKVIVYENRPLKCQ